MKGNKNYFELAGGSNYRGYNYRNCMMEIQGKSILVQVSEGFELTVILLRVAVFYSRAAFNRSKFGKFI